MMLYILFILTGILTWVSTGADDILAMYALMADHFRSDKIKVVIGTVIGTCLMFSLAIAVNAVAVSAVEIKQVAHYMCLLGVIPIFLGWNLLARNISIVQKEETKTDTSRFRSIIVMAIFTYGGNSMDDLLANLSVISQTQDRLCHACLLLGNILGCGLCAVATLMFHQKFESTRFQRHIGMIAGVALIIIGFSIMLRFFA